MSPTLSRWLLYRSLRTTHAPGAFFPTPWVTWFGERGRHVTHSMFLHSKHLKLTLTGQSALALPVRALTGTDSLMGSKTSPSVKRPILWLRLYFHCLMFHIIHFSKSTFCLQLKKQMDVCVQISSVHQQNPGTVWTLTTYFKGRHVII